MKYIKALIAVFILIILDQFTKHLAVLHLMNQDAYPIIKNVFELQYLENRGMAFGFMQNQKIFFVIMTIIVVALIIYFFTKIPVCKKFLPLRLICIFVIAGAIGNFIDRVKQSYVVDFLYFKLIDFPIFNVADIYVTCSAIAFLVLVLFYYKEEDYSFLNKKKEVFSDEH